MLARIFVLAIWVLLIDTVDVAHAAPVAGAIALVSKAIAGIAASGWLGALVVGAGKALVVGLLNQALGKLIGKLDKQDPVGLVLQTQTGDDQPLSVVVGRRGTAGKLKYWGTWGKDGKTPNAFYVAVYEVGAIASGAPQTDLQTIWIGETKCTPNWSALDAEGRGAPLTELAREGVDFGWVRYLNGSQTVAEPYLLEKFGGDPERPWTSDMIGRDKQLVIVTLRYNTTVFPSEPAMLVEPPALRMYDLRKDGSAGGNGPQRWNDPSTWTPTRNPAVILYNIIRGLRDRKGDWVYGGQNVAAYRLPASSWMAAANECDRIINGRPQFEVGAEIAFDGKPTDVAQEILLGCNGRLVVDGGSVRLLVGAPAAPIWHMTDASIIISDPQELDPWPTLAELTNNMPASYPDPASRWAMKDAPEYFSAAYVASDRRRLSKPYPFKAVFDSAQVQALQRTLVEEGRRFVIHDMTLPPIARLFTRGDVISWTSDRNTYIDKLFIIEEIRRLRGSLQRVRIRELDPLDYDPPETIIPPSEGWLGNIDVPAQMMSGWTAEKAAIEDNNGVARRPAIRVGCAADLDDIVAVHVQVSLTQGGPPIFDNAAAAAYPRPHSGGVYSWLLSGTWCVPAGTYWVRGRLVPGTERPVLWSDEISVTVDDIRLGDQDVFLPGVIEEVQERLKGLHEWLGAGTRDLIESSRKNVLLDIDADVGRYAQVQMVRQEVTATAQGVSAKATAELLAATGTGSAIAQSLTALNAAVFDPATGLSPTAAALVATTARVTTAEGRINTLSQNLVDLTTTVGSKASAAALSLLQTQVTQQGDTLEATSNSLTSLTTTVGKFSANGMFRISVEATPAGSRSRIGLSAAADGVEGSSAAALFLEAIAGGKSIAVVEADAFYVRNGAGREPVFAVSGGIVRMILAYIGTIRSGRLLSLNSKVDFDLDNGRLIFKS
ncbi:UNVERIFIED_ORG: phage tail protein [Roseateles sp. XES5]|nr:phage tail protein [Roseateles sp. XES5]